MINVEYMDLDIDKSPGRSAPVVFARKGEKKSLTVVATIADHGEELDLSAYEVLFECATSKGLLVSDGGVETSGSTVTYTVRDSALSSVGRCNVAYFTLKGDDGVVATTEEFELCVLPTAMDGIGIAQAYSSEIEELLDYCRDTFEANEQTRQAEFEAAVDRANEAADNVEQAIDGNFGPIIGSWMGANAMTAQDVDVIWGYGGIGGVPEFPEYNPGAGSERYVPLTKEDIDNMFERTV